MICNIARSAAGGGGSTTELLTYVGTGSTTVTEIVFPRKPTIITIMPDAVENYGTGALTFSPDVSRLGNISAGGLTATNPALATLGIGWDDATNTLKLTYVSGFMISAAGKISTAGDYQKQALIFNVADATYRVYYQ